MIILAGTIILSLNDSGVAEKAQNAVDETNLKEVQTLAALKWAEAYMDGKTSEEDIQQQVETALATNGVDLNKYLIIASKTDVEVQAFDKTDWEHAYTYTRATDEWSQRIEKADVENLTGDIIVKLYKKDELIDPEEEIINNHLQELGAPTTTLVLSNAYKMVIDGTGNMGALIPEDFEQLTTGARAWQQEFVNYLKGQSTFCVTPYITEVIIEDGITNIGAGALGLVSSLKKIIKGNALMEIDNGAFALCDSLENLVIPSSVTKIGEYAFGECKRLEKVYIPYGVTSIEAGVFEKCESLTTITLPVSITSIPVKAFFSRNKLTTINYTDTEEEWNKITLERGNESVQNATINFSYKGK